MSFLIELDPVASPNAVKLRSRICSHLSVGIRLIHGSLILKFGDFQDLPVQSKRFISYVAPTRITHWCDKDNHFLHVINYPSLIISLWVIIVITQPLQLFFIHFDVQYINPIDLN